MAQEPDRSTARRIGMARGRAFAHKVIHKPDRFARAFGQPCCVRTPPQSKQVRHEFMPERFVGGPA